MTGTAPGQSTGRGPAREPVLLPAPRPCRGALRVNDYQAGSGSAALMGRHVTHSPMAKCFLRKPRRQREAEPGVWVTLLFHATGPPLGPTWVPLERGASCHGAELTQDALSGQDTDAETPRHLTRLPATPAIVWSCSFPILLSATETRRVSRTRGHPSGP